MTLILAAILTLLSPQQVGTVLQTGVATWYETPGLTAAAGPDLRVGDWRGSRVRVCASECVVVTLTDFCACGPRNGVPTLLDLSHGAFARLAPLSVGVLAVTVETGLPPVSLPETDTE